MGRSGYVDDCDEDYNNSLFLYMRAVENALHGKRGQKFLRELIAALDAMPEKKLIREELELETGEVCALGSVGKARGIDMRDIDTTDRRALAKTFGIAPSMAGEIMFQNDDDFNWVGTETDEQRWTRIRKWAVDNLLSQEGIFYCRRRVDHER